MGCYQPIVKDIGLNLRPNSSNNKIGLGPNTDGLCIVSKE